MSKLKTKENEREIFADILRTIAIVFVIIIHTTCNYLNQAYQTSAFKWVLMVDSIVCIAVPIFFMLSGCFLIKKENTVGAKNTKRFLKRVFQLIFWTLVKP